MARFTDAQQTSWNVTFDVNHAKQVRKELDVDLLKLDAKLFERLVNDAELLIDILHVLCREQCEREKIDAVEFARRLKGDALGEGLEAMMGEVIDFFPPSRRKLLRAIWEKGQAMETKVVAHGLGVIEEGKMDRMLDEELRKFDLTLGTLFQNSPGS